MIQSVISIPSPTRPQIETLIESLNNAKHGLGEGTLWLFMAIDHVIQGLENENQLQNIGLTELASNFYSETIGGGIHVVTVNSALGSGNISNVIRHGPNDITGILGNKTFSAITMVNMTINDAGSFSAMFNS